jgi:hypothetical protein
MKDIFEHPTAVAMFVDDYIKISEQLQSIPWPEYDIHNGKWKVIGLIAPYNKRLYPNCDIAHRTLELMCRKATPVTLGFSILEPGCEIYPHVGYSDDFTRVHIGLQIPSSDPLICGIEIDGELYNWKVGESMIFDDRKMHSAWNKSSGNRIVLLADYFKGDL